jgi:hypothetical protein
MGGDSIRLGEPVVMGHPGARDGLRGIKELLRRRDNRWDIGLYRGSLRSQRTSQRWPCDLRVARWGTRRNNHHDLDAGRYHLRVTRRSGSGAPKAWPCARRPGRQFGCRDCAYADRSRGAGKVAFHSGPGECMCRCLDSDAGPHARWAGYLEDSDSLGT